MEYIDDDLAMARAIINANKPKKEKTIKQLAKYYWNSMKGRVGKGSYKNIKIDWEYSKFEIWFIAQEDKINLIKNAAKVPSIDRIDSRCNYCETNCRIIPNDLNVALGQINSLHGQLKKLYQFVEDNKHWI